jgi:hypothetical protein
MFIICGYGYFQILQVPACSWSKHSAGNVTEMFKFFGQSITAVKFDEIVIRAKFVEVSEEAGIFGFVCYPTWYL